MARNLRSKASSMQASEKPASDPPDSSKPSSRGRQAGSRGQSTKEKKGNGKKSTENVLINLKSPVLRDRTNLITELPNIDLLKKGVDDARVKPASKRTRIPSKTNDSKSKTVVEPPTIPRAVRKVQKKEAVDPKPEKSLEPVKKPAQKPAAKKSSLPKPSETAKANKNPLPPAEKPQPKRSLRISQKTEVQEENDKKFVNSKLKTPVAVPPAVKTAATKAKKAVTVSTTSRMKQTTLRESLSKAKPRNLREKVSKNSVEPAKSSKSTSPTKNPESKEKKPIYKSIEDSDTVENDKVDPYNFDYDKNDSQEKILPKKRKKPVRRAPVKRQKTVAKPVKITAKPVEVKMPLPPVETQVAKNAKPLSDADVNVVVTVAEVYEAPRTPKHTLEPFTLPKITDKTGQKCITAPRIISDEILDREQQINLSAIEPLEPLEESNNQEDFRPWRATNIFSTRPTVQFKSMMDHSLLQQAISPIKREVLPEFDVGSPWRPSLPLDAFSRVRNVVQSTPQSKKLPEKPPTDGRHRITEKIHENIETSVVKSPEKVAERSEEVENLQKSPVKLPGRSEEADSPQKSPVKVVRRSEEVKSPRKNPLKKFNSSKSPQKSPVMSLMSPRKFGTEISNLSDPRTSNSPRKFGKDLSNTSSASNSPRKFGNNSSNTSAGNKPSPLVVRAANLSTERPEMSANEKENSAPNCQSPEMSPNHIRSPSISPLTPLKERMTARMAEPQPGPSGLYKSPTRLKQSNLNSFLNLPPMPESTRISTADGIDDVHSTPITASVCVETKIDAIKEVSCLDIGVSPISTRIRAENVEDDSAAKPARYSVRQMRRALATQMDEAVQVDLQKNQENSDKQIAEFSDVFDCGDEQGDEKNLEECRLFMDLEPTHFKEPPKYSYKRKRTQSLDSSGEMDSDMDDEDKVASRRKRAPKKKRIGKVQREQNQKINEWAKNLNETFEEIDHFDLIVEPIHEKNK